MATISTRAVATRAVAAAGGNAPRDWNFIVLKASGSGLAAEIHEGLDRLDRSGTSPAVYITVRAEQNGRLTDYAVSDASARSSGHLHLVPGGFQQRSAKSTPMLSSGAIRGFVLEAMRKYPARHYLVALEGHSHDLRHALTPIHDALRGVVDAEGSKIDVLALDACFLAQVETAAEFQDVAGTLVASQEAMEGWRPVEAAAAAEAHTPMDAKALAAFLVSHSEEFTLSALDLSKTASVVASMKALSEAFQGVRDPRSLSEIRRAVEASQHFFTDGILHPDRYHNTVDVFDCMDRMRASSWLQTHEPLLVQACGAARDAVRLDPNGFVFAEKHRGGVKRDSAVELTDVRHAHGVSVYLPTTAPILRDHYTRFPHRVFERETGWDGAIRHLTTDGSPGYLAHSVAENADGAALQGVRSAVEGVEMAADAADHAAQRLRHGEHGARTGLPGSPRHVTLEA